MGVSWEVNVVRCVRVLVCIYEMSDGGYVLTNIHEYNK